MVMLLHCRYDAARLQRCYAETLQRCYAATLLRCYVATLLRCYSATLLCYYGSVIVLLFQRRRSLAIPESKKHLEKSPSKCKYVLAVRFSEHRFKLVSGVTLDLVKKVPFPRIIPPIPFLI